MYLMAEPFSSSTAGYVTCIGTPVIALLVAAMWRAWAQRLKKQDETIAEIVKAATESSKALAILLSDHNHVAVAVANHNTQLMELEKSTAVLASQVDAHHRWVERQQNAGNKAAI